MAGAIFTTFVCQPGLLVTDVSGEMEAGFLTTTEPALPDAETALDVFVVAEAARRHVSHVSPSLFMSHGSARPQPLFSPPLRRAAVPRPKKRVSFVHRGDIPNILDLFNHNDPVKRVEAARRLRRAYVLHAPLRPRLQGELICRIGLERDPQTRGQMLQIYKRLLARFRPDRPPAKNKIDDHRLKISMEHVWENLTSAERAGLTCRGFIKRVGEDYNRRFPDCPFAVASFIYQPSLDRYHPWVMEWLQAKGVEKLRFAPPMDPARIEASLLEAIRQMEENAKGLLRLSEILPLAHRIYCEPLPPNQRPTLRSFALRFIPKKLRSTRAGRKLANILRENWVHRYRRVYLDEKKAQEILRALEPDPSESPLAVGRKIHPIYTRDLPEEAWPTVQAFRKFVERMRRR